MGLELFYHCSFYFAGFFICLACFVYTCLQGKSKRPQDRFYLLVLLNVVVCSACAIIEKFAQPHIYDSDTALGAVNFCRFLYFIVHAALSPLFYAYMVYVSSSIYVHRRHKVRFSLTMIPFMVIELMVLTNHFTGWVYYTDELEVYHRGRFMTMFYIVAAIYYVWSIGNVIRHWFALTAKWKRGVALLFGITLSGVVLQMLQPQLQVELFAEAMGLVCAVIFIENDEDRMDVGSGLFNRSALTMDLKNYIKMDIPFTVVMVYVSNADTLNRLTGSVSTESLLDSVTAYLRTVIPYFHIYKTSPECFVLISMDEKKYARGELSEAIRSRFSQPWNCEGVEVRLSAMVMEAACPEEITTEDEVFLMTDSPKPVDEAGRVSEDARISGLKRSMQVEQALRRGFSQHNFEVFYQPVYFIENLTIHSAEALVRLHDDRLGDIPPSEFIPVAEHDGIIDQIGNFVLEEACLFLGSGLPVEMGIEYISVNLSILQCLKPGFTTFVKETTRKYDVSPSLISFEIKESAAVNDYAVLRSIISELKAFGFRFSMDSYGTGFSDMKSLYSLDFDVIKIDKSLLTRAREGEVGRIVLESCVRMIRQMHRRILVEGVETKEHMEQLKKLDVDYVQGYYSSRPITKNELLGILRATELARMEERRAIAASEAKSSFLANMSHEIRTPINAVLGMNQMIQRECDEAAVMRYSKEIETAGRNLLSLINNILDYSKIEAGEMEIVEAEYDLKMALGDVIRDVYRKTNQKHLTFRVYVSEDLPARLYGDEFRLKQILINLLNNAVKYTDEGGVSLTVEGEIYSEEEILLKISVEDTGIGIREEDQSKLYEMFQRLDMDRNRTLEGTGLGLAISYHLLQLMQGQIEVDSEYGVGSTFMVQLLQKTVGKDRIRPFKAEELKDIFTGFSGPREFTAPDARILVVDDTPLNHTVIIELLKNTKVQVVSAMSGEEALKMVTERHFDLCLMDQRMPGLSGVETLHRMRDMEDAVNKRMPVISMTANVYPGIRDAERRSGFEDYIEKPVEGSRLMEMMLKYLPESKVFIG